MDITTKLVYAQPDCWRQNCPRQDDKTPSTKWWELTDYDQPFVLLREATFEDWIARRPQGGMGTVFTVCTFGGYEVSLD
jgi:hypothetical protein